MKRLILLSVLCLRFGGCAPAMLTQEQIAALDYGAPLTGDYKEGIKQYFSKALFDPYSAVYGRFSSPEKHWYRDDYAPFPLYAGYFVFVTINAKNQYGGYVGDKNYCFIFKNDSLVEVIEGNKYFEGGFIKTETGQVLKEVPSKSIFKW